MLGIGARGLRDADFMSKSDPFLMISRPSTSGGFTMLRTSETKQNTLNPDWGDFLFMESELIGQDKELNLKFEVFDDDGQEGYDKKDKLLGSCWLNLKQLEAACLVEQPMPLSDGKSSKSAGHLLVRSYKEMDEGEGRPGMAQPSYPPQPTMGGTVGGYPQYPQSGGYPPAGGNLPPGMGGYPGVHPVGVYPSGQPGGVYPGGQPGGVYPGGQPGGAYTGGQPGGVYPGGQQGGAYPGGLQGEAYPGGLQGGAYQQGPAYPTGPSGLVYPGGQQVGVYPGVPPGTGYPQGGAYHGGQPGGPYPGVQPGGMYP